MRVFKTRHNAPENVERDEMYAELGALGSTWVQRGVDPMTIMARLLMAALTIAEDLGVSMAAVEHGVHEFYGVRAQLERPKAKA